MFALRDECVLFTNSVVDLCIARGAHLHLRLRSRVYSILLAQEPGSISRDLFQGHSFPCVLYFNMSQPPVPIIFYLMRGTQVNGSSPLRSLFPAFPKTKKKKKIEQTLTLSSFPTKQLTHNYRTYDHGAVELLNRFSRTFPHMNYISHILSSPLPRDVEKAKMAFAPALNGWMPYQDLLALAPVPESIARMSPKRAAFPAELNNVFGDGRWVAEVCYIYIDIYVYIPAPAPACFIIGICVIGRYAWWCGFGAYGYDM